MIGCAPTNYVGDAADIVKMTDWDDMETVEVSLTEFAFTPSTLTFTSGKPYKLIIKNDGEAKHYFVSDQFFRAIATRKVQGSDGEIKAPYFSALELFPGKELELYFVPVKKGTYSDLLCTIKGHAEEGMVGEIIII